MSNATIIATGIGATLQLFRFSFDLITTASQKSKVADEQLDGKQTNKKTTNGDATTKNGDTNGDTTATTTTAPPRRSTIFFNGRFSTTFRKPLEGGDTSNRESENGDTEAQQTEEETLQETPPMPLIYTSTASYLLLGTYFLVACILSGMNRVSVLYSAVPLGCSAVACFTAFLITMRDFMRRRFSTLQRSLHVCSTLILLLAIITLFAMEATRPLAALDIVSLVATVVLTTLSLLEFKLVPYPYTSLSAGDKKARLTTKAILTVLKPYFWPDATATSATWNRIRALTTWFCVAASKACNLMGPIFLGRATTALSQLNFQETIKNTIIYVCFNFSGSFFKECQSLVYLKVAQAAFVQLSEVSFRHLHSLSLDWHLKKKLGEVMRSMDRGILACDTLMKYLFLWLVPAIAECILVCVIFATYFDYFPLAVSVFYFVFAYMILTIVITLWRKKFRKQVAKSDNDWHDRATDSLINFETVKYFTAEDYEMKRFGEAVETYQHGSVNVAASLSFLNISQQLLLQACLATSLILSTVAIRNRDNCCVANGCDSGNVDCCAALGVCGGMEIGDFVAVLTYTLNLFMPLNFLGSVYNAIVMAMVDLTNLSELLAENPDVTDAPDAVTLPKSNASDPDTAVEFDNVYFHYPSQSPNSGLKGVSFKMKKGTINAVVGPTGAGKTTVSRLLFRFYDVLGGAVKVNGDDVRIVQQKSLRGSMGVVPQNTTLFNDTLRNNIRYGRRDATDNELNEVAEAAQLTTFIESLPDGWDTMVGDRGLKLSGGEKQRVAIARCLLKNPPIVILDEATSALDTITENSVQEALDRLGNDRTVLVIAHRLGTIRNADNIIVLGDGKVVEEGTHDELLAMDGMYCAMWNMQLSTTRTSEGSLGPLTTD